MCGGAKQAGKHNRVKRYVNNITFKINALR